MKNIAIFLNFSKNAGLGVASKIIGILKGKGYNLYSSQDFYLEGTNSFNVGEMPENIDLLLVLGGDGTFLKTARDYARYQIPILGVNLGTLGFLTEVELADIEDAMDKIDKGQYILEKRQMVTAQVFRNGKVLKEEEALNEITISKGPLARIINISIFVDDVFLDCYPGDGLIISTPTGSTGYSLSAGGPILSPNLPALLVTPICPHTLHSRSVVVGNDSVIEATLSNASQEVILSVDGQYGIELEKGDAIRLKGSEYFIFVVRLHGKNFFDILREKMDNDSRRASCTGGS